MRRLTILLLVVLFLGACGTTSGGGAEIGGAPTSGGAAASTTTTTVAGPTNDPKVFLPQMAAAFTKLLADAKASALTAQDCDAFRPLFDEARALYNGGDGKTRSLWQGAVYFTLNSNNGTIVDHCDQVAANPTPEGLGEVVATWPPVQGAFQHVAQQLGIPWPGQ